MEGKKLRTGLFGFNKTDVCEYIRSMDERLEEKIKAKDEEIESLKAQIEEMRTQRDEIVQVLHSAEKNARNIVEKAQQDADDIKAKTNAEIAEQKEHTNREIDVKRRAIKSYYVAENRRISQIKEEVEKLRRASLEAIKHFENELSELEKQTDSQEGIIETAIEMSENKPGVEPFENVVRAIHVHNISGVEKE